MTRRPWPPQEFEQKDQTGEGCSVYASRGCRESLSSLQNINVHTWMRLGRKSRPFFLLRNTHYSVKSIKTGWKKTPQLLQN